MHKINSIIFKLMKERFIASTAAVLCHNVVPNNKVNIAAPMVLPQELVGSGRCKLFDKYCIAGLNKDAPPEI